MKIIVQEFTSYKEMTEWLNDSLKKSNLLKVTYVTDNDESKIIAVTGNGKNSEIGARLIAACPKMYDFVELRAKEGDKNAQEILRDLQA